MEWFVYIMRCSDNSLYTGITKNIEKRIKEHNFSKKRAAKYTYIRRPVQLVYYEPSLNRSTATKREIEIKKLNKKQKEELVKEFNIKN